MAQRSKVNTPSGSLSDESKFFSDQGILKKVSTATQMILRTLIFQDNEDMGEKWLNPSGP
jgi:hypothetical protein